MRGKQFVFAGNRFFVLDAMLRRSLSVVRIFAVKGSFLERVLAEKGIGCTVIGSRQQLIDELRSTSFDCFVANGCPFILPIGALSDGVKRFVNVHPSPLPDLRGADPVPGAILHGRSSGATCHVMDDGIDTGPIIARVEVPMTQDIDCALLYQISFLAEPEAFEAALQRNFEPALTNDPAGTIYYSRRAADLEIDFAQPTDALVRRIRAWNTRSQGARFTFGGQVLRVFDAEVVTNPYLMARGARHVANEVVFSYENHILIRHGDAFLKLKHIDGEMSGIRPGQILGNEALGR